MKEGRETIVLNNSKGFQRVNMSNKNGDTLFANRNMSKVSISEGDLGTLQLQTSTTVDN